MSYGLFLLLAILGFGALAAGAIILFIVWYSPAQKKKRATRARKHRSGQRRRIDLCAPGPAVEDNSGPVGRTL